jgi:hypothetical protein
MKGNSMTENKTEKCEKSCETKCDKHSEEAEKAKDNKAAQDIIATTGPIINLLMEKYGPSYVNYVLFRTAGSMLLSTGVNAEQLAGITQEILDNEEPTTEQEEKGTVL